MMLAMYWIDIWTKPRLYLTPLDELALAAEIIAVLAVVIAIGFVILVARDERRAARKDKSVSLPAAAGPFPMHLAARDRRMSKPPTENFKPIPTPAPPPSK